MTLLGGTCGPAAGRKFSPTGAELAVTATGASAVEAALVGVGARAVGVTRAGFVEHVRRVVERAPALGGDDAEAMRRLLPAPRRSGRGPDAA